ncbi:hypothetical protein AB1Y20_012040 [Prymnesium parvum]|uniref:MI domain-containing protein n=1 Tax=Prymnesium parvum TaxID=97485 RepID=A0AB34IN14_PRYPA
MKVSLSQFHQMLAPPEAEAESPLPRGPGERAAPCPDARTRKWVVEGGAGEGAVYRSASELEPSPPTGGAAASLDEFKAGLDLCLREFLSGGDLVEATSCLLEMGCAKFHPHIVKRAILLAMDKEAREREMVAELFDSLHVRGLLTSQQIADGFASLLDALDDLRLDTPAAPALLAHFLADAILDGLLPPTVAAGWPSELTSSPTVKAVMEEVEARLVGRVPTAGAELRQAIRSVVVEYLVSHDATEVARRLDELKVGVSCQHEIIRAAIEVGLDRRDHERELISQLLSFLYDVVSPPQITRGFEQLILRIDDLTMDNPQASTVLAAFLVRAVADDVLPPAFVRQPPPEALATPLQLATLTQARAQLAAAHFGDKRRKVWGAAADADIATLKHSIAELVREYFVAGELEEAVRCIVELEAPFFLHEVVKRLVVLSLDYAHAKQHLARQLISRLYTQSILSSEQLALGLKRLVQALPDLRLDNPKVAEVLAEYIQHCCEIGAIPDTSTWGETARMLSSAECDDEAVLASVTSPDAPAV